MADRQALTVNDVVVSKVHEGHQLLLVTADPSDRLSLLYRGHHWSVPHAVARGARLAGRKGGHLWYTANNAAFDYLKTFRLDRSCNVALDSDPSTPRPHASRGRSHTELIDPAGRARPSSGDGFLLGRHGSDQWV